MEQEVDFYRPGCAFREDQEPLTFQEGMTPFRLHPIEDVAVCVDRTFCSNFDPFFMCMVQNATYGCIIADQCPPSSTPGHLSFSSNLFFICLGSTIVKISDPMTLMKCTESFCLTSILFIGNFQYVSLHARI